MPGHRARQLSHAKKIRPPSARNVASSKRKNAKAARKKKRIVYKANSKWTWLIYMAGDNNLQSSAFENLHDMAKVGSSTGLNIVAELVTENKGSQRVRIDPGIVTTLQTLGDVDTGKKENLTDFIRWGTATFPADRYALVVWNHGGGLEDLPVDQIDWAALRGVRPFLQARRAIARKALFRDTALQLRRFEGRDVPAPVPVTRQMSAFSSMYSCRAIALDVAHRDYLDNQAFRESVTDAGVALDLLGCDACLMNMLEIAYEMRDTAKVMVGSEQTEPTHGWPYSELFRWLTTNLDATGEEVSAQAVRAYGAYYGASHDGATTQSAILLGTTVRDLAQAVDRLAKALINSLSRNAGSIALARRSVLAFETLDYVDLGDLARLLKARVSDSAVTEAADGALEAIEQSIHANQTTGESMKLASGISIWFPSASAGPLSEVYAKLAFAKDTSWSTFLEAYFAQ